MRGLNEANFELLDQRCSILQLSYAGVSNGLSSITCGHVSRQIWKKQQILTCLRLRDWIEQRELLQNAPLSTAVSTYPGLCVASDAEKRLKQKAFRIQAFFARLPPDFSRFLDLIATH